ncbi:MAG: diacylglycerol kinase [Atopobiaceae bacterium]|nr:diacylglycerol kinase [Atopobiaceae bacterium]
MRSLIIHNIRSGFSSNAIYEFQRELMSFGDECVFRCLGRDYPIEKVLVDAEDFDLVVISGGDGTVANALYALRGRNIPTCVFPSGTANLLFSNLGNATEPAAIASACLARHAQPFDLGELRCTYVDGSTESMGFGIMSGIGFDAQLMQTAAANKQSLGEAAYFAAVLQNLNPPFVTFTITVDGKTYQRKGISCIVCNTASIQGDINILPGCTMDDGELDVMVLATTDAVQLLVPMIAGIFDPSGQTIGRPLIERFSGAEIRVESSEPLHIQRDGDASEMLVTSYEASCLPSSNLLVVDRHSPYYTA